MGSAYAAKEEKVKGSIEVGKMADLVVWNTDLLTMTNKEFPTAAPDLTIVGGEVVFGKP
jgi:hypothetical protein